MLRRSLLAAPLVLAATPSRAQQWVPRQPIKILVGYAPGGTADMSAAVSGDIEAAMPLIMIPTHASTYQ